MILSCIKQQNELGYQFLFVVYIFCGGLMNVVLLFLLLAACSGRATAKAPVYTHVTYLYDIKRGGLANGRSLDYYLSQFEKQLKSDSNMIIYGQKQMAQFVWQRRKQHNTVFIERPLTQFKKYWFSPILQNLRQEKNANPNFIGKDQVQFALQYYNTIKMAKIFAMLESLKYDKFSTDILIWVNAGFAHNFPQTVNIFNPENGLEKYYQLLQPQWLLVGYGKSKLPMYGYALGELRYIDRNLKSSEIVLSGHQGGYIQLVKDMKSAFENFLRITLQSHDLNSDEQIFSMMPIKFPYLIPTTTSFYLKQAIKKITIHEDISRKPSHSRNFGCEFTPTTIEVKFDYPISKDNIIGKTLVNIGSTYQPFNGQEGKKIEQFLTKPIRTIDNQDVRVSQLDNAKKQFYLHLTIMAVLAVSYGFIQSVKRSLKKSPFFRKARTLILNQANYFASQY